MGLKAEALRLKRYGAAASEGVEDWWWVTAGRLDDLLVRLFQQRLVVNTLPFDEFGDDAMQALAFDLLVGLSEFVPT